MSINSKLPMTAE